MFHQSEEATARRVSKVQCSKCKSIWDTGATMSTTIKSCPFCGKSLDIDTGTTSNCHNTIIDAIKYIVEHFGVETLQNGTKMVALLGDIAPRLSRERKMLSMAYKDGVHKLFFANNKPTSGDKEIIMQKAHYQIMDSLFMTEQNADMIISWFCSALGWEYSKTNEIVVEQKKTPIHASEFACVASQNTFTEKIFTKENANDLMKSSSKARSIPNGYTTIDDFAFFGAGHYLDNYSYWLYLPDTVVKIGKKAFGGATGRLRGIAIPDSVTFIGEDAFPTVGVKIKCSESSYAFQYCKAIGIKQKNILTS